jgi:spermidine/putrescine transport system permease protein
MRSKTRNAIITLISLWVIVFGGVPLLLLLITSFLKQHPDDFLSLSFSLKSYYQLVDPVYGEVMFRSVRQAGLTTLLCLIVGYPFAWITCRLQSRYRLAVLILMMIPFLTNSLIRTYAVRILLGTNGLINRSLLFLGLVDTPIKIMYTDLAVTLGLVYLMLPFMVLPLYANLEKFDYRLVEVSRDLGAGPIYTFRTVVWPLTLPGIIAGCIMVFVPTMGLFYVATLLGGARDLLVGNLIHQQFLISRNWPQGSALSVVLILMMILMLGFYGLVLRRLKKRREVV